MKFKKGWRSFRRGGLPIDQTDTDIIRVLHVEDEEDHSKFLEIFLYENDAALEVDSASSAEEALKRLKEKQYDCVVSDYMMPKVNGIKFAEQVKKSIDIPFIIYTGHGSEEVAQAAFTVGVDDYVRKEMNPSHYRVLAKSIRQAVEKKRAEKELKESLQTSSSVFRQLPSGVFIYRFVASDRLVLVDCNPEAMRQTNMDREEVIGKEFDELWGSTGAPLKREYLKAMKDGTQVKYDRLLWESPKIRGYFRLSAFPIIGDRLVVAFENISDQVRSEEKLEKLYESADKISETNTIEELEKASQRAILDIAGFDRGCIGLIEGDKLVFRPEDVEGAEISYPLDGNSTQVRCVKEGRAILIADTKDDPNYILPLPLDVFKPRSVFMVPFGPKDRVEGVLYVADSKPNAFSDNDRRLLETLSLYIETAYSRIRKRPEKTTKEPDELFRSIYMESPIGIEIFNSEGTIIDANQTSLGYFGVSRVEDLHGWNIFRDSGLSQDQKDRLRSGEEVRVETQRDHTRVKHASRKRSVSYFEVTYKPVSKGEGDSKVGYIGFVRDMTDAKLSQKKFREHTKRLEKAVEERSSELLEAERMATAGRVASMVGHDLRSPLQSVKNAVYMIKQKPELTPQMLGLIEGAVDRSLRMLDELRQRTREEPLTLAPTSLGKLVEDTVRETPHPSKVSIKVETEDVAKVSVDPLKVRRVLENLINNAVESIRTEGTVSVTLRNVRDGVEVEVEDNGRGIPSEEMVNLFKPFYTTKPGGMGLGLAFCKRTVEAHGGSIGVESEEGKGTTVTFKLPWARIRID
jgi:PAS domain S-box-containing protein